MVSTGSDERAVGATCGIQELPPLILAGSAESGAVTTDGSALRPTGNMQNASDGFEEPSYECSVKLMQTALQAVFLQKKAAIDEVLTLGRLLVKLLHLRSWSCWSCNCCHLSRERGERGERPCSVSFMYPDKTNPIVKNLAADKAFLRDLGVKASLHYDMDVLKATLNAVQRRCWSYALGITLLYPLVSLLLGCLAIYTMFPLVSNKLQALADFGPNQGCRRLVMCPIRFFVKIAVAFSIVAIAIFVWLWLSGLIPSIMLTMFIPSGMLIPSGREMESAMWSGKDMLQALFTFAMPGPMVHGALFLIWVLYCVVRFASHSVGILARWSLLGNERALSRPSLAAIVNLYFVRAELESSDPKIVWNFRYGQLAGNDSFKAAADTDRSCLTRLCEGLLPSVSRDFYREHIEEKLEWKRKYSIVFRPLSYFDHNRSPSRVPPSARRKCSFYVPFLGAIVGALLGPPIRCVEWYYGWSIDPGTWLTSLSMSAGIFAGNTLLMFWGSFALYYLCTKTHDVRLANKIHLFCFFLGFLHSSCTLPWTLPQEASLQDLFKTWKGFQVIARYLVAWTWGSSSLVVYCLVWSIYANIEEMRQVYHQLQCVSGLICRDSAHSFLMKSYENAMMRVPDYPAERRKDVASLQEKFIQWSTWREKHSDNEKLRKIVGLHELYQSGCFLSCAFHGPANLLSARLQALSEYEHPGHMSLFNTSFGVDGSQPSHRVMLPFEDQIQISPSDADNIDAHIKVDEQRHAEIDRRDLDVFVDGFSFKLHRHRCDTLAREQRNAQTLVVFSQLRTFVVMELLAKKAPLEYLLTMLLLWMFVLLASLFARWFEGATYLSQSSLSLVDLVIILWVAINALLVCGNVNTLLMRHPELLLRLARESMALSTTASRDNRHDFAETAKYAEILARDIEQHDTRVRLFFLEVTPARVWSLVGSLLSAASGFLLQKFHVFD